MTRDEDELRTLFGRLADRTTVHGTDGAWLRKRFRRRRARQSRLAAGLAAVAVAGVALVVALPSRDDAGTTISTHTGSPTPSPTGVASPSGRPSPTASPLPVPPPLTAKTGSRLVVVQGTHLELLDVDTGVRSTIPTDPRLANHDRIDVLAVRSQLVFLGDDQTGAGNGYGPVFATINGPGSSLRQIGGATNLTASDRPGLLWLVHAEDTTVPTTTLTEVDLQGNISRHAYLQGVSEAHPFAGGYLRAAPNDKDLELVDAAGHRLHGYPDSEVITVAGSTTVLASRVACEQRCELHVLTAGAGVTERTVSLDATALFDVGLTRDASRLFVAGRRGADLAPPLMLSEIDLGTGRARPAPDAWAANYYGPSMQFSSDGRWMFFTDGDLKSVDAYDLTTRRNYRVKGTFDVITQLALVP